MTLFKKRLASLFLGGLILVLAACASLPIQISTLEANTVPANTATVGIPVSGGDLANTQWTLVSFNETGTETAVILAIPPRWNSR